MHRPPRFLVVLLAALLLSYSCCQAFAPCSTTAARRSILPPPRRQQLTQRAAGGAGAEGPNKQQQQEFFRLSQGRMEFGTVDRVEMVLYEEAALIHQYITESPDRVILATWDEELVDRRARDVFRLTTKPMQFVTLNLQPSIDVKVSTGSEALLVESLAHSMNGVEQLLGQRFAQSLKIEVKGKLRAVPGGKGPGLTKLVGDVQFFTSGQLPLLFSLTPRPVLEGAAVAINRRIMGYAKGKFVQNLARDFDAWVTTGGGAGGGGGGGQGTTGGGGSSGQQQQQQQRKAAG